MDASLKRKVKIGIFILSLILTSTNALALTLSGIAQSFPEVPVSRVQMVYTLVTLVGIPSTVLIGPLSQFITKKKLIIIAGLVRTGGALFAFFFCRSMTALILSSIIIGFAHGIMVPLTSALIVEMFDGTEREATIGVQALFVNGGGILVNILAGILAAHVWQNTYLVFLTTVPALIVMALLVPDGKLEKPQKGSGEKLFSPYLIMMLIQGILYGVGWMTFMANASMYVTTAGIGTEQQASYLTTAMMIGATAIGLVLPFVLRVTGEKCYAVSSAVSAAALFLMCAGSNLVVLIFAGILMGFGFGVMIPAAYALLPGRVAAGAGTTAIGLFSSAFSLGGFINPLIITEGAALISSSIQARFVFGGAVLLINTVLGLIAARPGSEKQNS